MQKGLEIKGLGLKGIRILNLIPPLHHSLSSSEGEGLGARAPSCISHFGFGHGLTEAQHILTLGLRQCILNTCAPLKWSSCASVVEKHTDISNGQTEAYKRGETLEVATKFWGFLFIYADHPLKSRRSCAEDRGIVFDGAIAPTFSAPPPAIYVLRQLNVASIYPFLTRPSCLT